MKTTALVVLTVTALVCTVAATALAGNAGPGNYREPLTGDFPTLAASASEYASPSDLQPSH